MIFHGSLEVNSTNQVTDFHRFQSRDGLESKILWASLMAQKVKNLPTMLESWVWSLCWEDPLEKGTVTHSSILVWKIPRTEEPGRLQSMGVTKNWTWLSMSRHSLFSWFNSLKFSQECWVQIREKLYLSRSGSSEINIQSHWKEKQKNSTPDSDLNTI